MVTSGSKGARLAAGFVSAVFVAFVLIYLLWAVGVTWGLKEVSGLVERWIGLDVNLKRRSRRAPDPSPNVGQDILQLVLGVRPVPPICAGSERLVPPLPYAVKRSAYDVPRRIRFSTTVPVGGLGISLAAMRRNGRSVALGPEGVLASAVSQGPLPATARWSDRQQLNGLARTARSGPRRLRLGDLKLAQTCLDLTRPKSETGLRPRAHALTTEIARMFVHPSAAQAVLLGNFGVTAVRSAG